ncbi:MAG TPA: SDR family oxidoreductase [Acidimicrobiales bacterium]|nr:SDR family oxidoreductase [Acidimicrobiales bacterium]
MRILITGCSTGIGRATAVGLTERGHEVIATARRPESIADLEVAERLSLDVDDDASIRGAIAAAGEVDVLVNNAGFEIRGPGELMPVSEVKAMFETNVFGALRMMQGVIPQMRERGKGVIVNVSSVAGRVSQPYGSFYSASKFALEAITEGMHYELGHFGIRLHLIEPGVIETAFRSNIRHYNEDSPVYAGLTEQWEGATDRLSGDGPKPGPDLVAGVIAEVIDDDDAVLRHPVGEDAKLVISTRDSMPFEQFESTMRAVLQLDW